MQKLPPRPYRLLHASLIGVALALAVPSPAAAQAPGPAELEREARKAYERREFAVAARGFEAANRAAPHASLEFNAALAWDQAGDPARAADAYEAALAGSGLDADQAPQARARLVKLEQTLAMLSVDGPAGASVRVDGEASFPLPASVHVQPGDHGLEVAGAAQRVSVRAGERRAVSFAPQRPLGPPPSPPPPAPGTSGLRVGGWIALGAGVAAGVAVAGLGAATLSAVDRFKSANTPATPEASKDDLHDRAAALRTATNVTLGVALAAAATGVVLHLVAPRGNAAPGATTAALTPGGAALRLTF